MAFCLLPCDTQGRPLAVPPDRPWGAYLALCDGRLVGGGGFVAPPHQGQVEIGYFTLPDCQRQGHGRATAAALLALARVADPALVLVALTRRPPASATDDGASARILRALGFHCSGARHDAEAGPVWRWEAPPARAAGTLA